MSGFRIWFVVGVLCTGGWASAQEPGQDSGQDPAVTPDSTSAVLESTEVEEDVPRGPQVRFEVYLENAKGQESLLGLITLELNEVDAPLHSANFIKLVENGFYEGITFHRIVQGFMIHGGDPKSRINWQSPDLGTGGPDYTIPGEFALKHVRGAVAAARLADQVNPERESNGSQFYICLTDLPSLDEAGYSVFGKIVDGMDIVEKIAQIKNAGARNQNRSLSRVFLKNIELVGS